MKGKQAGGPGGFLDENRKSREILPMVLIFSVEEMAKLPAKITQ